MGHQESFLYCKDFDYLVSKIKSLGKNYFDDRDLNVVEIVTLDKNLKMHPDYAVDFPRGLKKNFKKGDRFIWITGQRQYQRRLYDSEFGKGLFGEFKNEKELIMMYCIECFSHKLFDENDQWLFTAEKFEFD
jgi:hypothetical protein